MLKSQAGIFVLTITSWILHSSAVAIGSTEAQPVVNDNFNIKDNVHKVKAVEGGSGDVEKTEDLNSVPKLKQEYREDNGEFKSHEEVKKTDFDYKGLYENKPVVESKEDEVKGVPSSSSIADENPPNVGAPKGEKKSSLGTIFAIVGIVMAVLTFVFLILLVIFLIILIKRKPWNFFACECTTTGCGQADLPSFMGTGKSSKRSDKTKGSVACSCCTPN